MRSLQAFSDQPFRAAAPLIPHSFHKARYGLLGRCIACRVQQSPRADPASVLPQTGTSVSTQCSSWVNEAFSEAGYLAQIKYHITLLFKVQVITPRQNCIMMCKSICLAVSIVLYFTGQTCHQFHLMGSLFPRQLLVLPYACFSLNSCFFTDIMSTFKII